MPRVYHVTFTKEFEANVLAESEDALQEALELENIDVAWDAPNDWDISIRDIMPDKALPESLPEYVGAVVGTTVYHGEDKEAAGIRERAEAELTKRWLTMKQLPLPFEKP